MSDTSAASLWPLPFPAWTGLSLVPLLLVFLRAVMLPLLPKVRIQKCSDLLPCHRQLEPLLRTNQVIDIRGRGVDIDLHPLHLTVEHVVARSVVGGNRLSVVATDLGCFVHGEQISVRALDAAFANLFTIDIESDVGTLADASTSVGEFHPYLVLSGR